MEEMDIKDLENKIDHASILMYQNQEKEALREMSELFPYLKKIISESMLYHDNQIVTFSILTMNELIDAYKNTDMLQMADCLQGKVLMILKLYENSDSILSL